MSRKCKNFTRWSWTESQNIFKHFKQAQPFEGGKKAGLHRMTQLYDRTCEILTSVCKCRLPAISDRKWKYLPGMSSNNGLERGFKVVLGNAYKKRFPGLL